MLKQKILELESDLKRQITILKPDPNEPGWPIRKVQSVYTVSFFFNKKYRY